MRLLLSLLLLGGCGRISFDEDPAGDAGAAPPDAPVTGAPLRIGDRDDADLTAVTFDTSLIDDNFADNCGGCGSIYSGPGEVGLLRFDLTGTDAAVISAVVEVVHIGIPDVNDGLVEVYEMLEAWDEGANSSQTPGFANWEFRQPGVAWSGLGATGASRADTPLASFTIGVADEVIRFALPPATVQRWIDDPASNHGVGFFGRDYSGTGGDHPHFRSSESGRNGERPILDLVVVAP